MQKVVRPFFPNYGTGRNDTTSTSAAPFTLAAGETISFWNRSTTAAEIIYVRIYSSANAAETATSADFPVPPGAIRTIGKGPNSDRMSVIAASGTPILNSIVGEGGV